MSASDPGQKKKPSYPSSSLRRVHITLISFGVAFAFLFAYLKLSRDGDPVWAASSFLAGLGLCIYLRSFLRKTG
jgi:hypothetical protein